MPVVLRPRVVAPRPATIRVTIGLPITGGILRCLSCIRPRLSGPGRFCRFLHLSARLLCPAIILREDLGQKDCQMLFLIEVRDANDALREGEDVGNRTGDADDPGEFLHAHEVAEPSVAHRFEVGVVDEAGQDEIVGILVEERHASQALMIDLFILPGLVGAVAQLTLFAGATLIGKISACHAVLNSEPPSRPAALDSVDRVGVVLVELVHHRRVAVLHDAL